MSQSIQSIQSTLDYLKSHQQEITPEIIDTLRKHDKGKYLVHDILDLPKTDAEFYTDAFGNEISFNGNRRIKKAFTKLALAPIHLSEIKRCADDIDYFKNNYVRFRTKQGIDFPEIRPYQEKFIHELCSSHDSYLVLFPRQSGKSSTTAVYLAWLFLFKPNTIIGICANRASTARDFLAFVKMILSNLPIWLQQGVITWNKGSISSETGTCILTDATNGDSFRGRAINVLVVDEVAFIKSTVFADFTDAVLPTQSSLSWKKTILISTPNGMNHFYKLVKDTKTRKVIKGVSKKDLSLYHDVLSIKEVNGLYDVTLDCSSNGYKLISVDWHDVPRYDVKGNRISPDEFKDDVVAKYGIQYFKQNYECDFIGSSATLIAPESLVTLQAKEPNERLLTDNQMLRVYTESIPNHRYIMAIDPAKDGLDYFALQIIDITSFPFEQVAAAKLQVDYLKMPGFIFDLASEYNTALVVIENNEGAGQSIADTLLRDYEYSNLYYDRDNSKQAKLKRYPGYRTTPKSRDQMLSTLKLFIENRKLIINDADTIFELERFIWSGSKYEATEGYHDDMVMSLAISFGIFNSVDNFSDIKELAEKIYSDSPGDISEYMTIGDFDDGVTDEWNAESWLAQN